MKPQRHQVPQQAQGLAQGGYEGDSDSSDVANVAEVTTCTDEYDEEGTCGDDELDDQF